MKAFAPHALGDFADIVITPELFTVKIVQVAAHSQQFQLRQSEFAKTNPEHPAFHKDAKVCTEFLTQIARGEVNQATTEYMCNVIIVDWTLIEDGEKVAFEPQKAVELFNNEAGGRVVASKLIIGAQMDSSFREDDLKNS